MKSLPPNERKTRIEIGFFDRNPLGRCALSEEYLSSLAVSCNPCSGE